MNNGPCFSQDDFFLFHSAFDLWNSIDESVRKQVLDSLGLLLLQYFSQEARCTEEESSLRKGNRQ
jgi:hypothetical protein